MIEDTDDVAGLIRVLSMYDDPQSAAHGLLNSEWILRHEFGVVRSFLKGCLEGVPEP